MLLQVILKIPLRAQVLPHAENVGWHDVWLQLHIVPRPVPERPPERSDEVPMPRSTPTPEGRPMPPPELPPAPTPVGRPPPPPRPRPCAEAVICTPARSRHPSASPVNIPDLLNIALPPCVESACSFRRLPVGQGESGDIIPDRSPPPRPGPFTASGLGGRRKLLAPPRESGILRIPPNPRGPTPSGPTQVSPPVRQRHRTDPQRAPPRARPDQARPKAYHFIIELPDRLHQRQPLPAHHVSAPRGGACGSHTTYH
jgi:hypothetical protein